MLCHSLEKRDYIFLLHKTHLAVNLGKFRLPVGTQVFIVKSSVDKFYSQETLQKMKEAFYYFIRFESEDSNCPNEVEAHAQNNC